METRSKSFGAGGTRLQNGRVCLSGCQLPQPDSIGTLPFISSRSIEDIVSRIVTAAGLGVSPRDRTWDHQIRDEIFGRSLIEFHPVFRTAPGSFGTGSFGATTGVTGAAESWVRCARFTPLDNGLTFHLLFTRHQLCILHRILWLASKSSPPCTFPLVAICIFTARHRLAA